MSVGGASGRLRFLLSLFVFDTVETLICHTSERMIFVVDERLLINYTWFLSKNSSTYCSYLSLVVSVIIVF